MAILVQTTHDGVRFVDGDRPKGSQSWIQGRVTFPPGSDQRTRYQMVADEARKIQGRTIRRTLFYGMGKDE